MYYAKRTGRNLVEIYYNSIKVAKINTCNDVECLEPAVEREQEYHAFLEGQLLLNERDLRTNTVVSRELLWDYIDGINPKKITDLKGNVTYRKLRVYKDFKFVPFSITLNESYHNIDDKVLTLGDYTEKLNKWDSEFYKCGKDLHQISYVLINELEALTDDGRKMSYDDAVKLNEYYPDKIRIAVRITE